ncbi:MAG: hypothetical protein HY454_02595 [Parcubacteria group bacterium]|nr:hypothetical protein [Parcubacteria group bacterium]
MFTIVCLYLFFAGRAGAQTEAYGEFLRCTNRQLKALLKENEQLAKKLDSLTVQFQKKLWDEQKTLQRKPRPLTEWSAIEQVRAIEHARIMEFLERQKAEDARLLALLEVQRLEMEFYLHKMREEFLLESLRLLRDISK